MEHLSEECFGLPTVPGDEERETDSETDRKDEVDSPARAHI